MHSGFKVRELIIRINAYYQTVFSIKIIQKRIIDFVIFTSNQYVPAMFVQNKILNEKHCKYGLNLNKMVKSKV